MTSIYDDIDQKKAKELYEKLPFIIIICNEARKICFSNAMARHNVYSLKKGTNLNRFFDFDIDPDKAIHVSIENADYVLFSTRITFEGENAWLLTFSAYSNILDKSFLESYWLKLTCSNAIRQLEYMKVVYQPNGIIKIMDKKEIRKEQGESPDYADTVMMAISI